jgi:hypothetical protein
MEISIRGADISGFDSRDTRGVQYVVIFQGTST